MRVMMRQGGGPAAGGACPRGPGLVGPFFLPVSTPGILCSAMQITRMLLVVVVPYGGGTPFGLDYLPSGSLCQPFGNAELSLGCQLVFESANLLTVLTPILSEVVEFVLEVANLLLHIVGGSAHLAGGRP